MQNTTFFKRYKLQHVFFWMLFMALWFMLRSEDYATPAIAFQVTLVKVADLILLVYITNYVLIPGLLYKKKYVQFILVFLTMIALSSIIKMSITGSITGKTSVFDFSGNWKSKVYDNFIPHLFLVIAGAAIKLMFDQISLQKKMADLAREKAEAELSFLKSQINPHFLFNSLNSVYFLIDKNNSQARQTLHKFSEMLRYQLYETNGDQIPIEKEIAFISDYMDLQKIRKDENYDTTFHCSAEVNGFSIEPLLLIPFLENAFKHVSHRADKKNTVHLSMEKRNGIFKFVVENSREISADNSSQPGGIGLANVKRRLELLYPQKHTLEITELPGSFKVELKIKV